VPSVDGAPQTELTKGCYLCSQPIPLAARKCTHCDSFQDWRRHLAFSSTILALLVALISVLTVAVPILNDALTALNSDITIIYHDVSINSGETNATPYLKIFLSNGGARGGAIGRGFLRVDNADGARLAVVPLRLDIDFVAPSDSTVAQSPILDIEKELCTPLRVPMISRMHLSPTIDRIALLRQLQSYSCRLTFVVTNFSGTSDQKAAPLQCSELVHLIELCSGK
jgi:hypothetical protein